MSNPTTPFGWQMPTNTDLVTDLPADFEVFGQAVATSMADLLGGTTGQVLAKNTNADMDFVWTSPNPGDITEVTAGTGISGGGTSGAVTITNSMATAIDAKGDLIVGTGADTFSRLASSAVNNDVLMVDTSTATGLKFATPSSGGYTVIASGSLSSTAVNITSIPSTYIDLVLFIENRTHGTTGGSAAIRINNDSSTIYKNALTYGQDTAITADQTIIRSGGDAPISGSQSFEMVRMYNYADAGTQKVIDINAFTSGASIRNNLALYCATTAISQVNIVAEGGRTLTGGTYVLYGVK